MRIRRIDHAAAAAKTGHGETSAAPRECHPRDGTRLLLELADADLSELDDHEKLDVPRWRGLSEARRTNALRRWLQRLKANGWGGAQRVFAYSFYRQGVNDAGAGTATGSATGVAGRGGGGGGRRAGSKAPRWSRRSRVITLSWISAPS